MKHELNKFRELAKTEKFYHVVFVEKTDKGYIDDADGKIYKSLDEIKAHTIIVDDLPKSTERSVLDG